MEYNTAKSKLINGEYGRHIQKMIDYAVEIKDRDLRNQQAMAIVRTMSLFSQGSKDTEDYWHKLWDQLFVISNFQLDVDCPFPKPTSAQVAAKPSPLNYPKHDIRIRPYGLLIENIIKKLNTEEDSPEKEQTIVNIANHLKKQYLNWNRDSVSDDLICEHLDLLSEGKIKLKDDFRFSSTKEILNSIAAGNANGNGNGSGNNNANKHNNAGGGKKKGKKKNNMPPISNANKRKSPNKK
jgi:hypothetical protein